MEIIIFKIVIGILLFGTILYILNVIVNDKERLIKILDKKSTKRNELREKLRLEEGEFKISSFAGKTDVLILRSDVNKYIRIFNTEIFLFVSILLFAIGFTIGINVLNNWLIGFTLAITLLLIPYLILKMMAAINYKKIDDNALTFINILQNNSTIEDDIVLILAKTAPDLENPLRNYIEEFCGEVRNTGDMTTAFRKLEFRIQNEKLKSIIRNIGICSRHEANYKEIIEDSREILQSYIADDLDRKAIIKNGRLEILLCIGLGFGMIKLITPLVPNLYSILKSNSVGNLILFGCIIVLIGTVINAFTLNKKD